MNTNKLFFKVAFGGAAIVLVGVPLMATRVLGLSAALATNLYYAVQAFSWGSIALSIVGTAGIGAAAGVGVVAMIRKLALKEFINW